MGYNKENYARIRREYETKALEVQRDADARRAELYATVPGLRELDKSLSTVGLRVMKNAMEHADPAPGVAELRKENERVLSERALLLRRYGFPADYDAPHYECDKCRDSGFVGIRMCECMRRRLIEAGMASSGLSGLMAKQSFDNFSLDYYRGSDREAQVMAHNFENARRYAETFTVGGDNPSESLLFIGGTGLGKTHLSTAVAKAVISRGFDVFYNSAVGMISDFEFSRFGNSTTGSGETDVGRYTSCDLLIIDDLGTEVVNQLTLSCLYHVINTRLNLRLPTLISTNLTSEELRRTYSDRLTSRLIGEYIVFPFYGIDVRKQKLAKKG